MAKIQAGTQGNGADIDRVGPADISTNAGLDGLGAISVADGGVPLLLRGNNAEVTGLPSWSGGLFGADRSQPADRITYESLSAISNTDGGKGYWGGQVGQTVRGALATAQLVNPDLLAGDRRRPPPRARPDPVCPHHQISISVARVLQRQARRLRQSRRSTRMTTPRC
jgi:hypothetical protein